MGDGPMQSTGTSGAAASVCGSERLNQHDQGSTSRGLRPVPPPVPPRPVDSAGSARPPGLPARPKAFEAPGDVVQTGDGREGRTPASRTPSLPPRSQNPSPRLPYEPPPRRTTPVASTPASSRPPTLGSTSSARSVASSPLLTSNSAFAALGERLNQVNLRDKWVVGSGYARELGEKGRDRIAQTRLGGGGATTEAINGGTFDSSVAGGVDGGRSRRILGVELEHDTSARTFGQPLARLASTRTTTPNGPPPFASPSPPDCPSASSIPFLPDIATACLSYLSRPDVRVEEGIYRVPGRAKIVSQLKDVWDAGKGREVTFGTVVGRDDRDGGWVGCHEVAALFKLWLRELPEPLLSRPLESKIDDLTLRCFGFPASSTSLLDANAGNNQVLSDTTGGFDQEPSGKEDRNAVADGERVGAYLVTMSELLEREMDTRHYYLLRELAFHFALVSSDAASNKMPLSNLCLVLSPTLRLSPGFLKVLVERRDDLFRPGRRHEHTSPT
ncbi:hypothetical protein JCM10212_006337 [Sporobolomyces blumeae]